MTHHAAEHAQPITDRSPEWTARRGGHPGGDRTSEAGGPLRFVVRLAVAVVLVAVVLLVLRPSHPEWLANLVHEIDGLVRMLS